MRRRKSEVHREPFAVSERTELSPSGRARGKGGVGAVSIKKTAL